MELTFDYINKHLDEYLVDDRCHPEDKYGPWNAVHGGWGCSKNERIEELEKHINWVYAIMPVIVDNGVISGKKVVKGFIYRSWWDPSTGSTDIEFTCEASLNAPYNKYYGHSVTPQSLKYQKEYASAFRMFTTQEEAKKALKDWVNSNKDESVKQQVSAIDNEIAELQKQIDALNERKNKLTNKQ